MNINYQTPQSVHYRHGVHQANIPYRITLYKVLHHVAEIYIPIVIPWRALQFYTIVVSTSSQKQTVEALQGITIGM
jgi:hypothetical protein